jgi:TDG/mug DNA glycosylase family protein
VSHVLPDLLRPGLRLVICGSAAGTVSAARGAYYAGPGNKFWDILHRIGLTPRRFRPEEYPLLLELGIGLTDLCKTAFGPDASLPRDGYDLPGLRARLAAAAPTLLAFNGKAAASCWLGLRAPRFGWWEGAPPVMVLPSTSGLACRSWQEAPWLELGRRLA